MRTGEAYLKVMNSQVVGIGGNSTGLGLFTFTFLEAVLYVPMLQLQQFAKVNLKVVNMF